MLTIIGCGNPNRSDDGVGVWVAQRLIKRLERHPIPGVQAFDCGTAGMEVMFAARGSDALILIDASRTGSPAGTIHRVPGEVLEQDHAPSYSLHDFRWDHALAAGRRIYKEDFPEEVTVWLIEAHKLELGLEMTDAVHSAAQQVLASVLEQVATYAAARHRRVGEVELLLRRGVLALPAQVYQAYFDGRDGAVVHIQDNKLMILPVQQAAGGLLVKLRNPAGDRSIEVAELLRLHGWDDWGEYHCRASWESELGALAVQMPERGIS